LIKFNHLNVAVFCVTFNYKIPKHTLVTQI